MYIYVYIYIYITGDCMTYVYVLSDFDVSDVILNLC
jgi:hypothetical protein